jgi:peroxiredoxin
MAATSSTMLELGTLAPSFALPDVVSKKKKTLSLGSFAGKKGLLVICICHHCPFVKHVKHEPARIGRDYANPDLAVVAISSNNPAVSADDSPEGLARTAADWGLTFPVCYDEKQEVAKNYAAACTPDFFLFDSARRLVYRGQLDDSRTGKGKPVTGNTKWRPGSDLAYVATPAAAAAR